MLQVVAVAPVTVQVRDAVVPEFVVYARAVKPVIALPPFDAGTVHLTTAWPLVPRAALTAVGCPGAVITTAGTPLTRAVAGLVPVLLVAVTCAQYGVPFVRPLNVQVSVAVAQSPPTCVPFEDALNSWAV